MAFEPNPVTGRIIRHCYADHGQSFAVIVYEDDGSVRTCDLDDPEVVAEWKMAAEQHLDWKDEQEKITLAERAAVQDLVSGNEYDGQEIPEWYLSMTPEEYYA